MVSNFKVQSFLRKLLIDGLKALETSDTSVSGYKKPIKVFWANIAEVRNNERPVNTKGIFIREFFSPSNELSYSDSFESGSGFWRILVYDDVGTGNRLTGVTDDIIEIFKLGTYIIEESESKRILIVIDDISFGNVLYDADINKYYAVIDVNFRKVKEQLRSDS